jgi:hypothetical protein
MSPMRSFVLPALLVSAGLVFVSSAARSQDVKPAHASKRVERGRYLVSSMGCDDCHSPKNMTPMGPVPDSTKTLSGHPVETTMPDVPKGVVGPQGWGALASNDFTAWAGPWGISFTANLTPDKETGLGSWTEKMFLKTIRTGKHMGEGRALLPPMPWFAFRNLTDNDLKSIFAYLQSLPPIHNPVPDPISPAGEKIPTPRPGK